MLYKPEQYAMPAHNPETEAALVDLALISKVWTTVSSMTQLFANRLFPKPKPLALHAGRVTPTRTPCNRMIREHFSPKTRASFLIGFLFVIMLQLALKYAMGQIPKSRHTSSSASDDVWLTSLRPIISSFQESRTFVKHTKPVNSRKSRGTHKNRVISQQQRSLHIVYRLSRFSGTGRGASRISNVIVSCVGIIGMFSAIVGALIGPWLAEIRESSDDERFTFWVNEEEEEENNEHICGFSREEKYSFHRVLDVS